MAPESKPPPEVTSQRAWSEAASQAIELGTFELSLRVVDLIASHGYLKAIPHVVGAMYAASKASSSGGERAS